VKAKELIGWLVLAAVAVAAFVWLLPQVFPLLPRDWRVDAGAAETIARERLAELGPLPADALVVTAWEGRGEVERRLLELGPVARDGVEGSLLGDSLFGWTVTVYAPDSLAGRWSMRARVSRHGKVTELRRQLPDHERLPALAPAAARTRADGVLADAGLDLASFGEPEVQGEQRGPRADLVVRYPAREQLLGDGYRHGVAVRFLGDRDGGWETWVDEPRGEPFQRLIGSYVLASIGVSVAMFLLLAVAAVLFARKYHAGEIGVRRAGHIFLLVLVSGAAFLLLYPLPLSEGMLDGAVSRQLAVALGTVLRLIFSFLPFAALTALAWSVGESWARERWGDKLAAFDAFFRRDCGNATVARAGLRGVCLGLAFAAASFLVLRLLQPLGSWPLATMLLELKLGAPGWLGAGQVLRLLCAELPILLVTCLFFGTAVARRLPALLAPVVGGLLAMVLSIPSFLPLPMASSLPVWALWAAVPVVVFWATDLLTALLTGLTASAVVLSAPLLMADDAGMQLQGTMPLLLVALPLLLSVRHLHGGRELSYRWEDVPPHVRRIAERERQRVELETAREIQAAILPQLPDRLGGLEVAHAYQPASEVGGDFYDVLPLPDGRVAVAVGDVAGHGVSSGLVMAMVRSALAVQVTFDPRVEAVFTSLNRVVHRTARRRLLTTLSYAVVDPASGEVVYASAGHIFPYRVSAGGEVTELESGSYPLGVRAELQPVVHSARLLPGDFLVLLSDGVVEARANGGERTEPVANDDVFGFPRLAASLERHANGSARGLVLGVLADVAAHSRGGKAEDDVTLVALRLPA
jgi:hypothetical protein